MEFRHIPVHMYLHIEKSRECKEEPTLSAVTLWNHSWALVAEEGLGSLTQLGQLPQPVGPVLGQSHCKHRVEGTGGRQDVLEQQNHKTMRTYIGINKAPRQRGTEL